MMQEPIHFYHIKTKNANYKKETQFFFNFSFMFVNKIYFPCMVFVIYMFIAFSILENSCITNLNVCTKPRFKLFVIPPIMFLSI